MVAKGIEKMPNIIFNLIFRFHFCFGSLLIVGIGSGMFHMTLLYEMQLLGKNHAFKK